MITYELSSETLAKIIPIGESFATEAQYPGGFNWAAFSGLWNSLLCGKLGRIFTVEDGGELVGALGMVITPDPYSGEITACEQFWYVMSSHRKTRAGLILLEMFEEAGKKAGAKKLVMVHLSRLTPGSLQAFYESQGYRLAEQTFWKEL